MSFVAWVVGRKQAMVKLKNTEADTSDLLSNKHLKELQATSYMGTMYEGVLKNLRFELDAVKTIQTEMFLELQQLKKKSRVQGRYIGKFIDLFEHNDNLPDFVQKEFKKLKDSYHTDMKTAGFLDLE